MAKGNWNPSVIKPRSRCRLCGRVIKSVYVVYMEGIIPCHRTCAIKKNVGYTEWFEKPPKKTEIELTDSVSIFVD